MTSTVTVGSGRPEPQAAGEQQPDEQALLARLRDREPAAWCELVQQHGGNLLVTARRILRDDHDAQDAVQTAFLSASQALPGFDGRSRLGTWLHRIVVNAALMKCRSRKRHPHVDMGELLPTFDHTGHFDASPRPWSEVPEDALEREESRLLVRAAIERLPEGWRTALLLRDIEELSNEEVARQLGCTVNAAKIRVHRARQALRTLLAPRFGS